MIYNLIEKYQIFQEINKNLKEKTEIYFYRGIVSKEFLNLRNIFFVEIDERRDSIVPISNEITNLQ